MSTETLVSEPPTRRAGRPRWLVPTGLIALSLIPVLAGSARLGELASAGAITPENERFFDSPLPVAAHIIAATVYSLLGAFQFSPALRRRRWHGIAGRILIPTGLVAAVSGLWMTLFYELPASDGDALLVIRLIFGGAMVVTLGLGIRSLVLRDYRNHGAWMTRAYAIGVAAGTQALIMIVPQLITGGLDATSKAVLMTLAWVINLGVAEFVIRRRRQLTVVPKSSPSA